MNNQTLQLDDNKQIEYEGKKYSFTIPGSYPMGVGLTAIWHPTDQTNLKTVEVYDTRELWKGIIDEPKETND